MSRTTPVLEDRLARYRPVLDEAIAERTAIASTNQLLTGTDLVELDWQPVEPGRSSNRSRVLVGASAVVMIGGLAAIVATRDTPPVTPANSVTPVDTEASNESTAPSGVVIDTAPGTAPGRRSQGPASHRHARPGPTRSAPAPFTSADRRPIRTSRTLDSSFRSHPVRRPST